MSKNLHAVPVDPPCLLCTGVNPGLVWEVTGADVRRLWEASSRHLSEHAFGVLRPDSPVRLLECRVCGFRYFDPALAGGGQFYEELERAGYYVESRPEFTFALDLFRKNGIRTVLDVGGGEGAFLDLARAAGFSTLAVELNEHAAGVCAGKGHQTLRKRLEEISAAELEGGVDALTFFQVIEHVSDPVAFLSAAKLLVRSGGWIIVAVPNATGQHRLLPFDPANMPPHHISRWRRADLLRLGNACGLRHEITEADPLFGKDFREFWLLHNRLAAAIGHPPHPGGSWLPKFLSFTYRKLGCRHFFPHAGLSLYSAYRKP